MKTRARGPNAPAQVKTDAKTDAQVKIGTTNNDGTERARESGAGVRTELNRSLALLCAVTLKAWGIYPSHPCPP